MNCLRLDMRVMVICLIASIFFNTFWIMLYYRQSFETEMKINECMEEIDSLLSELTKEEGIWK